jgi:hypothetical protein
MGPSGLSWDVAYEFAKAICAVVGAISIVASGALFLIGWYLTRSSEDLNRFSADR